MLGTKYAGNLLRVGLVGRMNVGKSAIYNRLLTKFNLISGDKAIVHDQPNTTKDGKTALLVSPHSQAHSFHLKDSAAFDANPTDTTELNMDVALMVVDAQQGVTPLDRRLALQIGKSSLAEATILVANKSESIMDRQDEILADLYELNLGDPVFVSTFNSLGWEELVGRIQGTLGTLPQPDSGPADKEASALVLALVGRPNTGKSSLVNALMRKQEAKIGEHAGTTTDAVERRHVTDDGKVFDLIDTAGVTLRSRGQELAAIETRRAVRKADVVGIVMDAMEILQAGGIGGGLSRQEMKVGKEASEVLGKNVVLIVNKWDLVPQSKQKVLRKAVEEKVGYSFAHIKGVPIIYVSAKTGLNVSLIFQRSQQIMNKSETRISTSQLNAWLRAFVTHHPVPWKDKMQCHIKFMTQVGTRPLTFALWTNIHNAEFPDNYLQLLKNTMREEFKLNGPPIVLLLRSTFVPKKVMKAQRFAPKRGQSALKEDRHERASDVE